MLARLQLIRRDIPVHPASCRYQAACPERQGRDAGSRLANKGINVKYLILLLTLLMQPGCTTATVALDKSDVWRITLCDYHLMPVSILDSLEEDENGVAVSCPGIEEVNPVSAVRVMPYAPLKARIVGLILVKKSVPLESYCKKIGANIIVKKIYPAINRKGYEIYDAYYGDN